MASLQPPILVRLKDCGDMMRFNSVREMQNWFERIDVENEEYDAGDATALPLKLSVQKAKEWLRVEPGEEPAPEQLSDTIREFAPIEAIPLESSTFEHGDFSGVLDQVMSAVRLKWQSKSWWQRLKRRFERAVHSLSPSASVPSVFLRALCV